MEKIKRALEIAEQQRLAIGGEASLGAASRKRVGNGAAEPTAGSRATIADGAKACMDSVTFRDEPSWNDPVRFVKTRVAQVSGSHLETNRIVCPDDDSDVSRAYDLLSSRVLVKLRSAGMNSIALVSPVTGDGKTLTGINLALRIAAGRERSALLVEADFRNPSIAARFGIRPQSGVEDVLQGRASIQETLVSPGIDRYALLPVRQPAANASELIDCSRFRQVAAELKNRYANRVVIFDLPPLLEHGDATTFLPNVDGALLVVADGRTSRESIEASMVALEGCVVIGTVLNQARGAAKIHRGVRKNVP